MTTSTPNKTDDSSALDTETAASTTGHTQLAHDARAKGTHLAGAVTGVARKARDAAADPEHATTRRAALAVASAAGVTAVVVNRVRHRRRSRNRLIHQLKRRLRR